MADQPECEREDFSIDTGAIRLQPLGCPPNASGRLREVLILPRPYVFQDEGSITVHFTLHIHSSPSGKTASSHPWVQRMMVSEAHDAPLIAASHRGIGVASVRWGVHMRKAAKRELIETRTDERYVRGNEHGQVNKSEDVGRGSAVDQKRRATDVPEHGRGDRNLALNSE